MEKTATPLSAFLLLFLTFSAHSLTAQCVPGKIGSTTNSAGAYTVSWLSQLIVDKSNGYTNTSAKPVDLKLHEFSFNARQKENPITPIVVLERAANDFLVMAIGKTRINGEYAKGDNTFPFDDQVRSIIVPPGAIIRSGFIEANPDGSGADSPTSITLDINIGSTWYTGGPSSSSSASVQEGVPVILGQYSFNNLNWSYKFNIEMCELQSPTYAAYSTGTSFYGVNSLDDLPDANVGDGICASANGHCSLRAAVEEANASPGEDVIVFSAIGDIRLNSILPDINSSITIDGYSAIGYQTGAPTVGIDAQGFNPFKFEFVDGVIVRGMDISSQSIGGFDGYALNFYTCRNVEVYDNIIRNRVRGIHANGVYDLTIENNDFRDCGDESVDGALFLRHILEEDIPGGMLVRNNQFGAINADPKSLVQVHYCRDLIISDGSIANTGLELTNVEEFEYPIRIYEGENVTVQNIDFSSNQTTMQGIGVRILDSENIELTNSTVKRRRIAVHVDGGNNVRIMDCDLRDSGNSGDEGTLMISNFTSSGLASLIAFNNLMGDDQMVVPTHLTLENSSGLVIGNNSSIANIKLNGVQSSYYPIRVNGGSNLTVKELEFTYNSSIYHQSKAIWIRNGAQNVNINQNSFNSWAAAVHVEDGNDIVFECNMAIMNRNGLLVDNSSTFSSLSDNNFACNAVAIQQRGSSNITTSNNYWGESSGSSSAGGTGDYIIGPVDVNSFNNVQNTCAVQILPAMCAGEICGNGIDDDLDGLTDCDDGGCAGDPACNVPHAPAERILSDITDTEELKLYPNPTTGVFTIAFSEGMDRIVIRSMTGSLVFDRELNAETIGIIDINHLERGAYLVEVQCGDRKQVSRILKQ